jgi:hypothetical protein
MSQDPNWKELDETRELYKQLRERVRILRVQFPASWAEYMKPDVEDDDELKQS